ncbi:MAG: ATP synthase subunit I [Tissierellia bacterium]|nr:ATP synthase subunit I [Tissierellia bacterium]
MKDKHYLVRIIENALRLAVLEIIIFLIFSHGDLKYVFGILIGTSFSIAMFLLMYRNIIRLLEKTEFDAKRSATVNYFMRFVMTGVMLALVAMTTYIDFFTTVLGLFNIKIVIYIENFHNMFKDMKK